MPDLRKLNLRMPPDLHAALLDLAARECMSANAVAVAALRNWIEYRSRRLPRAATTGTARAATTGTARPATTAGVVPKVGVNQPCPCGSGQKYKRCHGRA